MYPLICLILTQKWLLKSITLLQLSVSTLQTGFPWYHLKCSAPLQYNAAEKYIYLPALYWRWVILKKYTRNLCLLPISRISNWILMQQKDSREAKKSGGKITVYCILQAPLYSPFSLYTNKKYREVYFQNYIAKPVCMLHTLMLRNKLEVNNHTVLIFQVKFMS